MSSGAFMKRTAQRAVACLTAAILVFSGVPAGAPFAHASEGDVADGQPVEAGSAFSVDTLLSYMGEVGYDGSGAEGEREPCTNGSDGRQMATIIVELEPDERAQADTASRLGVQELQSEGWQERHARYKSLVRSLAAPFADDSHDDDSNGSLLRGLLRVMGIGDDATGVEDVCDYRNAIDGFAVKAPLGVLSELRAAEGVRRAFAERTFEAGNSEAAVAPLASVGMPYAVGAESGEGEPANRTSLDMTGADQVASRGDGQVIAILDSGFDTDHEALCGEIDEDKVAWSKQVAREKRNECLQGGREAAYVSAKVPFAYDYGEGDSIVDTSNGGLDHGMHVAGIAGANGGEVRGTAPHAQLALMKVANDLSGTIRESSLIAALDDAVVLQPDVLSMSIGSDGGFSSDESGVYGDIFEKLESRGCTVCVSAGNSYTSARGNRSGRDLAYANDPDAGITSSPASLSEAIAVGSLENARPLPCFTAADGLSVSYVDGDWGSTTGKSFDDVAEGTYEYVDAGYGTKEECKALAQAYGGKLSGKIVLVEDRDVRGENGTLVMSGNRAENIAYYRPVAIVMYNAEKGSPSAKGVNGCTRAVACITNADGLALKSAAKKTITVKHGQMTAPTKDYEVDAFSSWGTTPEMTLKPDIAAPGGTIYSSVLDNKYGYKSGTSMATPQVSGLAALMREYIAKEDAFSGLDARERADLVSQLLMSTARPLKNLSTESGYYSPRQQGAGSVDVRAAMGTSVYLTVDGAHDPARPKAELGESLEGEWSFSVTLHNFGETARVFSPKAVALSESVEDGMFQQVSEDYAGRGVTVGFSGDAYDAQTATLSVEAGSNATLRVSLSCTDDFKAQLAADAPNGTFIEGFAFLRACDADGVDVSVPYVGFFGDWSRADVFDAVAGSSDGAHLGESHLANGNTGRQLGSNPLSEDDAQAVDCDQVVVSVVDDARAPNVLSPCISTLRGASSLRYEYRDASGTAVRTYAYDDVGKCCKGHPYLDDTYLYPLPTFIGTDDEGSPVPDGKYTLVVTALTAGPGSESQSCSLDFVLDTKKPIISDYRAAVGDEAITFTVTEDTCLAGIDFHDPDTGAYFYRVLADDVAYTVDDQGRREYAFTIERSEVERAWVEADRDASELPAKVLLCAWDYGLNRAGAEASLDQPEFDIDESTGALLRYNGTRTVVEIPDMVTSIAAQAFKGSTVKAVSVPAGVKSIGEEAFAGTEALEQVSFSDDDDAQSQLTSIGAKAFQGSHIREISLPRNVASLGAAAFSDSQLETVSLPSSLTALPERAFAASALQAAYLPSALESLGEGAFSDCASLVWLGYLGGGGAVEGLPPTLGSISERAFEGCGLKRITLNEGVKAIFPYAFAFSSIEDIVVPDSVSVVAADAFSDMKKLVSVTLGAGVSAYQAARAFVGDPALRRLSVSPDSKGLSSSDGVLFSADEKTLVLYPPARLGAYIVPAGVSAIGVNAFKAASLEEVSFAGTGVSIGDRAFEGSQVSRLDLSGVERIGKSAFADCGNLESVDFGSPSSILRSVEQSAFSPGTPLAEVVLPDSVTAVGDGAFANNASLSRVSLGSGFSGSFGAVFEGCENIRELSVSSDNASYKADSAVLYALQADGWHLTRSLPSGHLSSYQVMDGTVAVDARAFSGNEYLKSISFPEGLVSIGAAAFAGCTQLEQARFPDSLEFVSGFYQSALVRAEFGTKVKAIRSDAFNGHNPAYIVVKGGQLGSYSASLENTGETRPVKGAYFGEGMSSVDFSTSVLAPPSVVVVSSTVTTVKFNAPSVDAPYDPSSVRVYAVRDTAGWKAARAALEFIGGDPASQLEEYRPLAITSEAHAVDEGDVSQVRVVVQVAGGAGAYQYRFVAVSEDDREVVLKDWNSESSCSEAIDDGSRIRCDVCDESGLTVSTFATQAHSVEDDAQPAVDATQAAGVPQPTSDAASLQATGASLKKGQTDVFGGNRYVVTSVALGSGAGAVAFAKAGNARRVSVPAKVKLSDGKTYKVTSISVDAFKGSRAEKVVVGDNVIALGKKAMRNAKRVRVVVLGKNVRTIGKGVFSGAHGLKRCSLKSSKVTKVSFRNMLRGSEIKTIKLSGVSEKARKSYRKWAHAFGANVK